MSVLVARRLAMEYRTVGFEEPTSAVSTIILNRYSAHPQQKSLFCFLSVHKRILVMRQMSEMEEMARRMRQMRRPL
jgi:ABC-type polar amino acid transport system ATPase subunit